MSTDAWMSAVEVRVDLMFLMYTPDSTAVQANMSNVYELPNTVQTALFGTSKAYRCGWCDVEPESYTVMSAHATRCEKRMMKCPECGGEWEQEMVDVVCS